MQGVVAFLRELGFWGVFFGSAVPLTEQRAAIPLGIWAMELPPLPVMFVSLLGSLLPVPFVLLFFNGILGFLRKFRRLDFFTRFIDRKVRAGSAKIERYKEIGLILFIAIPLPMTGLWTGSAAAAFLGFNFKKSLLCAFLGGLISATAVTAISVFFPALFGYSTAG
ncbi:MAG: small multi-drug export protein [Clostridiales bacterium]|jgi:uncharacterized membrane protein|nr:small multi-drug export protein [Clostridiales bacterium]